MLKAVVKQVKLGTKLFLGKKAGGEAGFPDDDRNVEPASEEKWFIAEVRSDTRRVDQPHAAGMPAITPRKNIEGDAPPLQFFAEQNDERSFAGSAGRKIADADDRAA